MVSIIQKEKECYVCKTTLGLHLHHIYYGTGNRRVSDANGFTVYLCGKHHNLSNYGVHFDSRLDNFFKKMCQAKYEKTHSREEFMALVGRNYLDEEDSTSESETSSDDSQEWLCDIGF